MEITYICMDSYPNCGGLIMDVSYYYQILDTGILYEKGGPEGKRH